MDKNWNELISDLLIWNPTHEQTNVGKTYQCGYCRNPAKNDDRKG